MLHCQRFWNLTWNLMEDPFQVFFFNIQCISQNCHIFSGLSIKSTDNSCALKISLLILSMQTVTIESYAWSVIVIVICDCNLMVIDSSIFPTSRTGTYLPIFVYNFQITQLYFFFHRKRASLSWNCTNDGSCGERSQWCPECISCHSYCYC